MPLLNPSSSCCTSTRTLIHGLYNHIPTFGLTYTSLDNSLDRIVRATLVQYNRDRIRSRYEYRNALLSKTHAYDSRTGIFKLSHNTVNL